MSNERYSHVESRKREGAHYTPEVFSDFISEKIISNAKLKGLIRIVDPAVGDGELLLSLIKNLKKHGINEIEAYGFDTNPSSIEITRSRLKESYPDITISLHNTDFLKVCLEKRTMSGSADLFISSDIPEFDLLIANPPYIRTQVLGAEQAQWLSKTFGLKGRIDIYQAFLVAMKSVMHSDGVAGVIVSNRFMTTKGAGKFREILYNQYAIKGIWDFGDTKVFEASVLPAVLLLSPCSKLNNTNVPYSSVYLNSTSESENGPFANNQIDALNYSGTVRSENCAYTVKSGHLGFDAKPSDVWRLQDQESEEWLSQVAAKTWCTFKNIGKIRVGVKTTADSVYIRSDWNKEIGYKPELLLPLTTHHVARRFKCSDKIKKEILYTHTILDKKRSVVNIDDYPLSKQYLESNKEQLAGRKYVIEANRKWFEIWVPQNPAFWKEEKIIFRDISEQPTFWIDKEGSVVNGDCYWMLKENNEAPKDILWLVLAIANSRFIEDFYDVKFQNKLYSNKRRFISQYVEQFPLPNPELKLSKKLVSLAMACYEEDDSNQRDLIEKEIDQIVYSIFDIPQPTIVMD